MLGKLKYAADAAGTSIEEVMSDKTGRYNHLINKAPPIDVEAAKDAAQIQLDLKTATTRSCNRR